MGVNCFKKLSGTGEADTARCLVVAKGKQAILYHSRRSRDKSRLFEAYERLSVIWS